MSALPKSALRGHALKQSILDTALELFSEKGYFNTSMHDIRRAAGVSIGAIYHHFDNKEALARALYESLLAQMERTVEQASMNKKDCRAKSESIIQALFALTVDQPRNMQFILLAQHREYLPDEAPICSSTPFQIMKNVVVEGLEAGEIRDMDKWVAATAVFGGALRMMSLKLDGVLDRPLMDYLDEVVNCAWQGIE